MTVGVHGLRDRRMTKSLLHDLGMYPLKEHERCGCVPADRETESPGPLNSHRIVHRVFKKSTAARESPKRLPRDRQVQPFVQPLLLY
jgi:hypothetical protein